MLSPNKASDITIQLIFYRAVSHSYIHSFLLLFGYTKNVYKKGKKMNYYNSTLFLAQLFIKKRFFKTILQKDSIRKIREIIL